MKKINPVKYSEIKDKFGDAGTSPDIIKAPFPFPLYLNGDKTMICRNFYGHKYIASATIDAFKEILDIFGLKFIQRNGLDNYGGCFNYRKSRTNERISVHSWGLAVDYLPNLGKLGEPSLIPFHIVQAFKNRGFIWGGDWNNIDGMHFSAVIE